MAIAETFERLLADGRDSLWCIGFVVLHVFFFVEADLKKQCLPFEKIKMLTSYN